jgi:cell division protein FtsB
MKKIKPYLIVALLFLLSIILLSSKLIIWGISMLAAALIILGIQQLIKLNVKISLFEDNVKKLYERNDSLETQNRKLAEENTFLKERNFKITQIKSILELNLFEIDTKFTRSISTQETVNDKKIKYFGSLGVSLTAKYGIDCKELRFKYDPDNDVLRVANINPKFLSFGNRKLEWDFFEIYEFRGQNILADKKWIASDDLYQYADELKEKYRVSTEKSLEKGPEEFSWIHAPIKQNVENTIRVLFGGMCRNIIIADHADESFLSIDEFSYDSISEQKKLTENNG